MWCRVSGCCKGVGVKTTDGLQLFSLAAGGDKVLISTGPWSPPAAREKTGAPLLLRSPRSFGTPWGRWKYSQLLVIIIRCGLLFWLHHHRQQRQQQQLGVFGSSSSSSSRRRRRSSSSSVLRGEVEVRRTREKLSCEIRSLAGNAPLFFSLPQEETKPKSS